MAVVAVAVMAVVVVAAGIEMIGMVAVVTETVMHVGGGGRD
jgi:hypothetical protein